MALRRSPRGTLGNSRASRQGSDVELRSKAPVDPRNLQKTHTINAINAIPWLLIPKTQKSILNYI